MKSVELFNSKVNCCGCGACMNICPVSAIKMEEDETGYIYPYINEELCIHCGQCQKVCSYQHGRRKETKGTTYAAAMTSEDILKSSSGGVFAGIARNVLKAGGIVYGCMMSSPDEDFEVKHIRIDHERKLDLLRGSKYVHSSINSTYKQAKDDLVQGKTVLFSGTPCQIDGLYGFLQKEYDSLFTLDLVCHGVPSQKLFNEYIKNEEKRLKGRIQRFSFREKTEGWKLKGRIDYFDQNDTLIENYIEPEESSYYQLFLNAYTYRINCYSCPYAGKNRPADLTIGDFWNIELTEPDLLVENGGQLDPQKGISCLIVNNGQGEKMLSIYSDGIQKYISTFESASKYNGQLRNPSLLKPEREVFLAEYSGGYECVESWYRKRLALIRIKRRIRKSIPQPIKKAIKKLIR